MAYAAAWQPMSVNALQLIFKQLQVQGFFLGYFDYEKKVLPAMRAAAPLVASGALHVPVTAIPRSPNPRGGCPSAARRENPLGGTETELGTTQRSPNS